MIADVESIFFNVDDFATSAVYSSHDGDIASATITIIFDTTSDLGGTDYGMAEMAEASIKLSDVPNPKIYDKLTVDGVVYTVRMKTKSVAGVASVLLEADQRQKGGL